MTAYAAQRAAPRTPRRRGRRSPRGEALSRCRAAAQELRCQRRQQRWARQASDAAWAATKRAHTLARRAWRRLPQAARRQQAAAHEAASAQWQAQLAARRAEQAQRQGENAAWQAARHALRTQQAELTARETPVTAWLAILVVIDNCSRRCLGLAQFPDGPHVSAAAVVAALGPLLPPGLQFLISDNGAQFTAEAFAALLQSRQCVHVRTAPCRPCTNGIAERFVQTLKDWLREQSWQGPEQLAALLPTGRQCYNERPHQGAELGGLSPNEYTRRLKPAATC